jgi:hypothetical protein
VKRKSVLRQGMADFFTEFGGIDTVANLIDVDFQALMEVVQKKAALVSRHSGGSGNPELLPKCAGSASSK